MPGERTLPAGLPAEGEEKKAPPTIAELLDRLAEADVEEGRVSSQRRSVLKQAREAFGAQLANGLTTADVERFISAERGRGLRNGTINRTLEVVRRAFKLAKLAGPEFRHLSERDNVRKGFFSPDEFRRLASYLPADLRDFCLFAFLTSWRKSEIASLRWSDVENDVIRLRAEHAKTREARSIVIAGDLIPLIERRRAARLVGSTLTDAVFHRSGGAAPVREFRKSWATACKRAGVAGRLFHDLRRSGVRNMVRSGVPQSVAMRISGHKTASMFRRYDIANEDDLRSAMVRIAYYNEEEASKVATLSATV